MKGSLHTDELMGAVVRRETGLRTARRVSHCFVMDVPSYAETLIVTDAAINIAPTLEDKVDIIQNAIDLAHAMRFPEVRVAILSAMETVNPKVPSTIEAGALCKMADRGQITGAILDGPLALDNAISLESVKIKKIDSPVAGRANVLVVPDLEAGNMLAKSLSFLAGADAAGIVLGARVPIILTSRADSVLTRLASVRHRGAGREGAPRSERESGGVTWPTRSPYSTRARRASSSRCSPSAATRSSCGAGRRKGCTHRRVSSPRIGAGSSSSEKSWGEGVALGHAGALDHLVAFLRARARRAPPRRRWSPRRSRRTRVRQPVRVDATRARGAREVHSARAAASAAQSGADPGAAGTRAGAAAGRLLRHRVPPGPAAGRAGVRTPAVDHRSRRHPLRLPRPVVRVHRAGFAGRTTREPPPARSSCCIWATVRACAR